MPIRRIELEGVQSKHKPATPTQTISESEAVIPVLAAGSTFKAKVDLGWGNIVEVEFSVENMGVRLDRSPYYLPSNTYFQRTILDIRLVGVVPQKEEEPKKAEPSYKIGVNVDEITWLDARKIAREQSAVVKQRLAAYSRFAEDAESRTQTGRIRSSRPNIILESKEEVKARAEKANKGDPTRSFLSFDYLRFESRLDNTLRAKVNAQLQSPNKKSAKTGRNARKKGRRQNRTTPM